MLVLADAWEQSGLGHLSRSSAVAVAVSSRGITVACRAYGAREPLTHNGVRWQPLTELEDAENAATRHRAVVLDSYRIPLAAAEVFASQSRLVVIHDVGEVPRGAALVVSPASDDGGGPGRLCGLKYACLGPQFWGLPPRRPRASVKHVLVMTGGDDPGCSASALASAVADALPSARIELVRNRHAHLEIPSRVTLVEPGERMLETLTAADLVLCAAGQTLLEACAVGTPCISAVLADNQQGNADALERRGATVVVDPNDPARLTETVALIEADAETRRIMSRAGQEAIDGYGALRVGFQVARLIR